MRRIPRPSVSALVIGALSLQVIGWRSVSAQQWNDARTRALVAEATSRRAEQLGDTTLAEYEANAHGYVTFLAQLGRSALLPPKIVKTDELELEIKWHAPNLSKQTIVGRRDTLLLPTDIEYHRDHLGIVQNNFPDIIRIGEGDEVRDVPHPLSPRGAALYDFAISDSLRIRIPGRDVDVFEVRVRPKNDRVPAVIGAVYIDPSGGQVVRMAFNFTHASFLDASLEDLSVVLENRLVGTRYWLPSRQEIEIRRAMTWMDYPVRGIIRGRWEIGDYRFDVRIPATTFTGPEIVAAPIPVQRAYPWKGGIMDSLPPDLRAPTEADIAQVQAEARSLVRAQALASVHRTVLSANGVSDLIHFNRVEGLTLGSSVVQPIGPHLSIGARGEYGFDIKEPFGDATMRLQRISGAALELTGVRTLRDVGDTPERSGVANTIAAQEFGSDFTDLYLVRGASFRARIPDWGGVDWSVTSGFERHDQEVPHAHSVTHDDPHFVAMAPGSFWVGGLELNRPAADWIGGWTLDAAARGALLRATSPPSAPLPGLPATALWSTRLWGRSLLGRDIGSQRLLIDALGGISAHAPIEEWVYLGGPVTAPGYGFHQLVSRSAGTLRAEWQTPVPFPGISLGRFGRAPGRASLDFYGGGAESSGWYPFAGVGLTTPFDLLRFDVSRGFNNGKWMFSVDLNRDYWGIL